MVMFDLGQVANGTEVTFSRSEETILIRVTVPGIERDFGFAEEERIAARALDTPYAQAKFDDMYTRLLKQLGAKVRKVRIEKEGRRENLAT